MKSETRTSTSACAQPAALPIESIFPNTLHNALKWEPQNSSHRGRTQSIPEGHVLGANPIIGVIYHWIGGFASATNFIPFRRIRRWSFEIYWIVQGVAAWIIAPLVLAGLL